MKTTGTATETENVVGVLFNEDGSRAAHAKVKFIPADYTPGAGLPGSVASAADSTITDDTGHYEADSLPPNTYNLSFIGNGGYAFRDSIEVRSDSLTNVPSDTLKAPGSLHGTVRLQPGDDPRTISILFIGTTVWGTPNDSTGAFDVANLAGGSYRVRFLTTLDNYAPKDTVLRVIAGKSDTLSREIVLRYTGIPAPHGLAFTYDTLRHIVVLRWNRPAEGRPVESYNIYRRMEGVTAYTRVESGTPDTTWSDSAVMQDIVYEYRIAAIDTNGSEGVKSQGLFVFTGNGTPGAVFSAPMANAVWTTTTVGRIEWKPDSSLLGGRVDLFLYKNVKRVLCIADNAPNSGEFLFTAPSILETGNDYRIGIAADSATAVADFSAMFTISGLAPDAFEPDNDSTSASLFDSLGRVQTHTLTYHDTDWVVFRADSGRLYRLKLSGDVSAHAGVIRPGDLEGYSYFRNTTIPSTLEWTCISSGLWYVCITPFIINTGGTYTFSITRIDSAPKVTVTSPTFSIPWVADSSYWITWTPDSSLTGSRFMLWLFKGDQAVYAMNIGLPNIGASYHHVSPDLISGNDYRIKVVVYSNQDVMEGFSVPFTIYGINVDKFEPDGKRESASTVEPGLSSSHQQHTLTPRDTDWVSFDADSGVFFGMSGYGLVPTMLCLFYESDTAAIRQLRSPPLTPWVCPRSGKWYARITQGDSGQLDGNSRIYYFWLFPLDSLQTVRFFSPPTDSGVTRGSTLTIRWRPDSLRFGDSVLLSLYKGEVRLIALTGASGSVDLPNSGNFDWTVPRELEPGCDYRIQINTRSNTDVTGFIDFSLPFTVVADTPGRADGKGP
jgi:hypothetical protein